jgi:hypothetical protein
MRLCVIESRIVILRIRGTPARCPHLRAGDMLAGCDKITLEHAIFVDVCRRGSLARLATGPFAAGTG